jgi:hypothetical protein
VVIGSLFLVKKHAIPPGENLIFRILGETGSMKPGAGPRPKWDPRLVKRESLFRGTIFLRNADPKPR